MNIIPTAKEIRASFNSSGCIKQVIHSIICLSAPLRLCKWDVQPTELTECWARWRCGTIVTSYVLMHTLEILVCSIKYTSNKLQTRWKTMWQNRKFDLFVKKKTNKVVSYRYTALIDQKKRCNELLYVRNDDFKLYLNAN